jgi:phosphopantetheine adenylyltransferase
MKAERMFDKVIIVYAENPDKPWTPENVKIPKILKHTAQVEVVKGSLVKWIEALPYPVTIIRGLRNSTDLQYEQNYIAWLQALATKPLDFVFIPSDKDVEHISSSAVRTLIKVDPLKAKDYYYE